MQHHIVLFLAMSIALSLSGGRIASAGTNTGASATLSWSKDSLVANLSQAPSSEFSLYLVLNNIHTVRRLGIQWIWSPSGEAGYTAIPVHGSLSGCLEHNGQGADSTFLGETYDWALQGAPPDSSVCIALTFSAANPLVPTPARMCVKHLYAMDANAEVDEILVDAPATILDAAGCPPCPLTLIAATPQLISTDETPAGMLAATPDRSNTSVTLIGTELQHLAGCTALSRDGIPTPAALSSASTPHTATISLSGLNGLSPWSLIAVGLDGRADTLRDALAEGTIGAAHIIPLAQLGSEWHLPSLVNKAWSPNGEMLALYGPDGLYVWNMMLPSTTPLKVLSRHTPYFTWSPNGDAILCRVPDTTDISSPLSSLLAVPTNGANPCVVLSRADIETFAWPENDSLYYWDLTGGHRWSIPLPAELTQLLARGSRANGPTHVVHTAQAPDLNQPRGPQIQGQLSGARLSRRTVDISLGSVADGTHLVFRAAAGEHPTTILVDDQGTLVRTLSNGMYFSATSPTPDGRFVVGQREVDAHNSITSSRLMLIHVATGTTIAIKTSTDAGSATISPHKYIVAYNDPVSGGVHVGALVVQAH